MVGAMDADAKPILVVSNISEMSARLYQLPSFEPRGVLPQVPEARGFCALPEQRMLISGDRRGEVKIFQFARTVTSPGS